MNFLIFLKLWWKVDFCKNIQVEVAKANEDGQLVRYNCSLRPSW